MKIKILSILLVCIGLIQSIGFITGSKEIKGIGFITAASPLPIVFTQQKGFLETFALDFTLIYHVNNTEQRIPITPELYSMLDRPYNYRNVLGAAISYGPVLPEELVSSILNYSFIAPGVLSESFNLREFKSGSIELTSKTKNVDKTYTLVIGTDNDN